MQGAARGLANAADVKSLIRCMAYGPNQVESNLTDLCRISEVLEAPETLLWLDVVAPTEHDFEIMREEFQLHPLAIEDALKAHQRTKLEQYGDVWFFVVNAATYDVEGISSSEIAIFAGTNFIITVRSDESFSFDSIYARWNDTIAVRTHNAGVLLFTVLDAIVDGFLPVAEALEEQVDMLDTSLLVSQNRTEEILLKSFQLKKNLNRFRRIVAPMQTLLHPIIRGDLTLVQTDVIPYFRDVDDHVLRALVQVDDAREQITNARETHVALASHRQNEVSKQLTLIATIFLPLTFITGFFGQNFAYLTNAIVSEKSFWWLGIGTEIFAVVALLGYARYRHWR
jgi:magnesium transporter